MSDGIFKFVQINLKHLLYECRICHASVCLVISKRNPTSFTCKGKYKSQRLIKQRYYCPVCYKCDIVYKILNTLSQICSLTLAQV